ncbi:MAG TPA: hypothetical protein ENH05_04060 [Rhizobiales bacterium]|nr:hypothetical protein BMS3Bbin10_01300 [bacterium BMS3Bbin10]HDO51893.1 hypothetical protein [Hyphomicrobiales bacterium]
MSDSPKTIRKAAAHLAGAGVYVLIALAGMIAYVLFYKTTGPRVDALVGGAIVLFLPVMLIAFGLVVWTPAWMVMKWRRGRVAPRGALKIAALLSFLGTLLYCGGFSCFTAGRTEHMVGWFFVAFAALGAAAHSAVYLRLTRVRTR